MNDLSPTATKIHKMKYAKGEETWEQTCYRVASYVAGEDTELLNTFFNMIYNQVFIPGGRVLANAGTEIKNLNNCFVLPIEDSRQSIYKTLGDAAEIFAWGGGLGYNFSKVREEGAPIKTTGGNASGPLSFMTLFDQTGEVIQQASRRGAQMGMLNIDHPDIEKFIDFKGKPDNKNARLLDEYKRNTEGGGSWYYDMLEKTLLDNQLTHFNISVVLTDEFMEAALENEDWNLISRVDGSVTKTVKASELLDMIAKKAWESGDPGVFFKDRANEDNILKSNFSVDVTNPCVTGDTKIATVHSGNIQIKELAEKGQDILVHSWNPETKLPVVRMMRNIRKTRENVPIVEVEFDSGLKVKCTPDHNFFSFRGNKIQAKDLEIGQSVRAYGVSVHKGHLRAHGWKDGKACHQYVARLVWECFNDKVEEGYVIHHKDFNKQNNKLSNLMYLTNAMHSSIHAEQGRWYGDNHKVVDIRDAGKADVYNGTVDDSHTYIIADDEPIGGVLSGIVSANCGEVPLLPYEPCCLGSINLHAFYDSGNNDIKWEFLELVVRNAITFLDNVQSLSSTPLDEVNYWSKSLRRLGLGVMGWADLLAEMGISYTSDEALQLADRISWFITYFSYLQSISLASERGAFEQYNPETANLNHVLDVLNYQPYVARYITDKELREVGLRNVAVTSIAPTGSIALLANVNSSIEPFFALAYKRHITEGVGNMAVDTVIEINPVLFNVMERLGYTENDIEEIKNFIVENGTLNGSPEKFDQLKARFYTSQEIEPNYHIKMQAAWQTHIDNSISKTINMPNESTVEDVRKAIIAMWAMDLKGGTIYRDGSKMFQILNKGV